MRKWNWQRPVLALAIATAMGGMTSMSYGQATVEYWDMQWGAGYQEAATALAEKFNAEHPDIKVDYHSVSWANWYETYASAVAAGTEPDAATGGAFMGVQMYDAGAVGQLDELIEQMKADGTYADFLEGVPERLQYDGHYIGLPFIIDTRVWWYRKDMLEQAGVEPPKNWTEFRAALKAVKEKTGKAGIVISADATQGLQNVLVFMINNGGGVYDKDGNYNLVSDRNKEAMQFMSDLVADGSVHEASVGATFDQANGLLMSGEAAFVLGQPGFADSLSPEDREKVAILPPMEGLHGDKGTLMWVANIIMFASAQDKAATMTFIKWWSEHEHELFAKGAIGGLPPRKSISEQVPALGADVNRGNAIDWYVPVAASVGAQAPGLFPQLNILDGDTVLRTLAQDVLQGGDVTAALEKADGTLKSVLTE